MIREHRAVAPGLPADFYFEASVSLRGELDMLADADRTIAELQRIDKVCARITKRTLVRLDLQKVTEIDAPSLLLLCSRLKELGSTPWIKFWGNYPEAERPRRMLRDAKFGEFMSGRAPSMLPLPTVVELAMGSARSKVKPSIGDQIQTFLVSRHPNIQPVEKHAAYTAVMECLENVRTHAYQDDGEYHTWYVVGYYDDDSGTSSIAILDRGVGIRATVAPKMTLGNLFTHPADYLQRATEGFSQTGDPKHGKGLREIREFASTSTDRTMFLLSSSAMLRLSGNEIVKDRVPRFKGTIICVQIHQATTPRRKS